MAELIVCDGRVCIIKLTELSTEKEDQETLKNALIDFTTSTRVNESDLDIFLFVDLSPFRSINSSLIGIFGSVIMDKKVQLLGLCNAQPAVLDILKRIGVISDDGMGKNFATNRIIDNIGKIVPFHSIEDGLISLNQN
jgi:hypothetical protein